MHHELPERLNVAWFRARARDLHRSVQAGNADSRQRVEELIGQRPSFKLADAQHVIALEHGFGHWADFRRWVETRSPEPKVGRIGRAPVSTYEQRADKLVAQVRAGEFDALRRVRHHVPRLAQFTGSELALADARIVVAREYGLLTWRDLVGYVQAAIDKHEEQPAGDLGAAFELIRAGDVVGFRRMLDADPSLVRASYKGAATTMLEANAQPDVFGKHLEVNARRPATAGQPADQARVRARRAAEPRRLLQPRRAGGHTAERRCTPGTQSDLGNHALAGGGLSRLA